MDVLNALLDFLALHNGCLFQTPYPEGGTSHAFTAWFFKMFSKIIWKLVAQELFAMKLTYQILFLRLKRKEERH